MQSSKETPAAAVLLAAGRSTRMDQPAAKDSGRRPRKPFIEVGGKSLLERSLATFCRSERVREIVLVIHPEDQGRVQRILADSPAGSLVRAIVHGGAQRIDSVRAGVLATSEECGVVLVHDVARPFVTPQEIDAVALAAEQEGAALLAAPVCDTIKRSEDGEHTRETVDRSGLWSAQTPQAIRRTAYCEVLERAQREGFEPTDDAALYERYCGPVRLVQGSPRNFKITTAEDLQLARALVLLADKESDTQ